MGFIVQVIEIPYLQGVQGTEEESGRLMWFFRGSCLITAKPLGI